VFCVSSLLFFLFSQFSGPAFVPPFSFFAIQADVPPFFEMWPAFFFPPPHQRIITKDKSSPLLVAYYTRHPVLFFSVSSQSRNVYNGAPFLTVSSVAFLFSPPFPCINEQIKGLILFFFFRVWHSGGLLFAFPPSLKCKRALFPFGRAQVRARAKNPFFLSQGPAVKLVPFFFLPSRSPPFLPFFFPTMDEISLEEGTRPFLPSPLTRWRGARRCWGMSPLSFFLLWQKAL